MAIALELQEERGRQLVAMPRTERRRPPWVLITALLVLAVAAVFIVGNERQANTQFDQADHALVQTRGRLAAAEVQLSAVRQNLEILRVQIAASEKSLSADTTSLQAVRVALSQVQEDVAQKSTYIVDLKACQGGVEQALNALSVGDETHAVAALDAVSAACQNVTASSG